MKVKKFVAATMPEAMSQIKKDLGTDAVILHSKVIHQKRFLGLIKKRSIEVIAALDSEQKKTTQPERSEFLNDPPIKIEKSTRIKEPEKNAEMDILQEIKGLKKWLEINASEHSPSYPGIYQFFYHYLVEQEVERSLAKDLIETVINENDLQEGEPSRSQVRQQVIREMQKRLKGKGFGGITHEKKYIHLAGPTGVGKTTTIAKLAANAVLKDHKKVALVTTDTYRIAAIDQLKTYAKILDVPLEVAYNADDYKTAIDKFKSYDLIIVDTAGRNYSEMKYIHEYKEIAEVDREVETYLVFSLTTRAGDIKQIFQQFESIPVTKFIFTKKDETSKYGALLNLCLQSDIGVAYITDGQNVPDDIEEASVSEICKMIVGDDLNE